MELQLHHYHPDHLATLADLRARLGNGPVDAAALAAEISGEAHDHGRQVVVATAGAQVVGYGGWITLGVRHNGDCYGFPVIAEGAPAYAALLGHLREQAVQAGAKRLRIGCGPNETIKAAALNEAGFKPAFEFVYFARSTRFDSPLGLPPSLRRVPREELSWRELAELYADTFRHVPNAPPLSVAQIEADWAAADWDATHVLVDRRGRYQAFVHVSGAGNINEIGVRSAWRRAGLASCLYEEVGRLLAQRSITTMTAMVGSNNPSSMQFHQKLGFTENAPRRSIYELSF